MSDYKKPFNSLVPIIPTNIRNAVNTSLLSNVFDKNLTHEEAIKLYGLIGKYFPAKKDTRPWISQPTVERELNMLTPMVYAKYGIDEFMFSFDDMLNKARISGVDVDAMSSWGESRALNFAPPIDIDKFTNFSSYYWIQETLADEVVAWNPNSSPEYYMISKPKVTDAKKMPVSAVFTDTIALNGTTIINTDWKVVFTNATTFTVSAVNPAHPAVPEVATIVTDHLHFSNTYLSFTITKGSTDFIAGDTFDIALKQLSTLPAVITFTGTGTGFLTSAVGNLPMRTIDGLQLAVGMRVLVTANGADNGIYIVAASDWTRAYDASPANLQPGTTVFVKNGPNSGTWEIALDGSYSNVSETANLSEWEMNNYWVHKDDLHLYGLTTSGVVNRAIRPIIEYRSDLEQHPTIKTKFNQAPLFKLYWPDATEADWISSIFFYVEDATAPTDLTLQRRVKADKNGNFIFGQGTISPEGRVLAFKVGNSIQTSWAPGPSSTQVSVALTDSFGTGTLTNIEVSSLLPSQTWTIRGIEESVGSTDTNTFSVVGSKTGRIHNATASQSYDFSGVSFTLSSKSSNYKVGDTFIFVSGIASTDYSRQEIWTLSAKTPGLFSLAGSRAGAIDDVVVGAPYVSAFVSFDLDTPQIATTSNFADPLQSLPFIIGQTFTFRVAAPEAPRYVKKGPDALPITYPGGASQDATREGCWLTAPQLVYNPELENRNEILYGDLVDHFTSVIDAQPAITGSLFGLNNFHRINPNLGLGGRIKALMGNSNLFYSMLNQQDLTPLSLLDFAEQQYSVSLNSLSDFLVSELPTVLANNPDNSNSAIFAAYSAYYGARTDKLEVFKETTSPITNWPLTLPLIGALPGVLPKFKYDLDLGVWVLIHHDGHEAPIANPDKIFEHNLALSEVLRSDGTTTGGTASSVPPIKPYKGQLWFDSVNQTLKYLKVQFDTVLPPNANAVGDLWYARTTDTLFEWDGLNWVSSSITLPWVNIYFEAIDNGLKLYVETKLYDYWLKLNADGKAQKWNTHSLNYFNAHLLEYELSKFAVANGYDPLGSNYVSNNPFTWNYHLSGWPSGSNIPTGTARWHVAYRNYFAQFTGGLELSNPLEEPWKLFGISAKPISWTYDWPVQIDEINTSGVTNLVTTVSTTNENLTSVTVINGVTLANLNTVLLTGQTNPEENGVYEYSFGQLTRSSTFNSSISLAVDTLFAISSGYYKDSLWTITVSPTTVGVSPIEITQARRWNPDLWIDIQAAHPGIKICVNPFTDTLLPPYVASSPFALLNNIPLGISDGYSFLDEGPVEQIWMKSLAYNYARARVSYKLDPIKFLKSLWGFQMYEIDGLILDRITGKMLSHKDFTLHSEPKPLVAEVVSSINTSSISGPAFTATFTVFSQQSDGIMLLLSNSGIIVKSEAVLTNFGNIIIKDAGNFLTIGDKFTIEYDGTTATQSFIPSSRVSLIGIGQIYSQFLKYNSLRSVSSQNVIMLREWNTKLGYRTSSLLETDSLVIKNDLLGTVPETAYSIKLNQSHLTQDLWLQALRVQIIKVGSDSQVVGQDTDGNILYVPTNKGEDWVFRVENYFARHPQIDVYLFDKTKEYETFNSLSKANSPDEWINYQTPSGIHTVNLPITITGIQNVVDFIHGYAALIEAKGFAFGQGDNPSFDPETNRIINWQLEIEKYIDYMYRGTMNGAGFSLNPFMKKFWLYTPTGLPASFVQRRFDDILTSQFTYDLVGDIIDKSALTVIRFDDHTEITGNVPLFGAHITIDNYEHVILFENYISEKTGLFFDPFLGLMVEKLQLQGKVQTNFSFRPSFGGFFLQGNQFRKNIAGSIDDVANYYNTDTVFENETTTRHALSLLGFNKKDYFKFLDVSEKTEFNFWRALINAKGTVHTIDAFLNSSKFEYAKVDEFWAYKIAEYGDARAHEFPELKLNSTDCSLKHTRIYFDGDDTVNASSNTYIVVTPTDENRWYSLVDLNTKLYFEPEVNEVTITTLNDNEYHSIPRSDGFEVLSGPVGGLALTSDGAVALPKTTAKFTVAGTYRLSLAVPAKPKFSPIKLIDYVDKALIEDITTWHPAFDNHTATAMEVINVVSTKDPAKYSYSTLTVGNSNYDPSRAWNEREVGRTWWDTTNLDYIPYYDSAIFPTFEERLARWGSLAEYASINVYEWVSSDVPPTEYDALSKVDQLSADISNSVKKTGAAARKQSYKRSRNWNARPVAWSYVPTPPGTTTGVEPSLADQDVQIFNSATTKIFLSNPNVGSTIVSLDKGRFSQYGITSGMHISGWQNNKPIGELELIGNARYNIGTSTDTGGDIVVLPGNDKISMVSVVWADNKNFIGAAIGAIDFSFYQLGASYYATATERGSGTSVNVAINDYFGIEEGINELDFSQLGIKLRLTMAVADVIASDIMLDLMNIEFDIEVRSYSEANVIIPFPSTELDNLLPIEIPVAYSSSITVDGANYFTSVTLTKGTSATIGNYQLARRFDNGFNEDVLILMKDGIELNMIPVPDIAPSITDHSYVLGDLDVTINIHPHFQSVGVTREQILDELTAIGSLIVVGFDASTGTLSLQSTVDLVLDIYGWRAWKIPTQAELTSDLASPYNSWTPVYGDWASIPSTRGAIDAIVAYNKAPLVLNSNTSVERFASVWNEWKLISPEIIRQTGTGSSMVFTFSSKVDASKLSLYKNGINRLPSFYSINSLSSNVVTTTGIIPVGHEVVGIIPAYEPTASELAFDPDVLDDASIQMQYKNDYQYVTKNVRDEYGNLTGNRYFFWVKGRTVANTNKNISSQQAEQLLKTGPSSYITFQELTQANDTFGLPLRYKGVTFAGLNLMVSKDNTFKLRFTRDFTLRDNPNDIDLKNTHAEWVLLRQNQKHKIPEVLWNKMVDTACGQNVIGQTLPSLTRSLYDERHNARTRYGFGPDQVLAERSLVVSSLTNTMINPKTTVYRNGINTSTVIAGLNVSQSDTWFATPQSSRKILDFIWRTALPSQINELFFEVLNDALANNYEFSDIFKTSRISAHSIITIKPEFQINDADVYY